MFCEDTSSIERLTFAATDMIGWADIGESMIWRLEPYISPGIGMGIEPNTRLTCDLTFRVNDAIIAHFNVNPRIGIKCVHFELTGNERYLQGY